MKSKVTKCRIFFIRCRHYFGIVLAWFRHKLSVCFQHRFQDSFLKSFYGFRHENGAEVVPQNGHKSNKKSNLFPLGIIFGISVHFGINLVPFWHTFGVLLVTLGGLSVPIDAVSYRFSAWAGFPVSGDGGGFSRVGYFFTDGCWPRVWSHISPNVFAYLILLSMFASGS